MGKMNVHDKILLKTSKKNEEIWKSKKFLNKFRF